MIDYIIVLEEFNDDGIPEEKERHMQANNGTEVTLNALLKWESKVVAIRYVNDMLNDVPGIEYQCTVYDRDGI